MINPITEPPEISEKKLTLFRKYTFEIISILLFIATFYLYQAKDSAQNKIIQYYKEDHSLTATQLQKNNDILENNNVILRSIREITREIVYMKKDTILLK